MAQKVFKRHELKYLITYEQFLEIKEIMSDYMTPDKYHKSTIRNIYYDNPSFLLIRRSIEKPMYKEKLRIRAYETIENDGEVFVELKKKYNKEVFKRREILPYSVAINFLDNLILPNELQITKEIEYFLKFYKDLKPSILLSYDREAYISKTDKNLRITFDENILWRDEEMDLRLAPYGSKILPEGKVLMEIKTVMGYPKWLMDFLSANKIYKTSFSKYANAYKQMIERKKEEQKND